MSEVSTSQKSQSKPAGNTKTAGQKDPPKFQLYRWAFTIPYEECSASQLSQNLKSFCKKFVFQAEKGNESGYLHWQGCLSLNHKEYFHTVKNLLGNKAHLEPCKEWFACVNYCSKEDTRIEGPYNEKSSFIDLPEKLLQWQLDVIDIIKTKPNDRTIHWYWEPTGCKGKTVFCKYLYVHHGATLLCNCATKDAAYAMPDQPTVVCVNLTRTNEEHINYGMLEAIKDGLMFSAKYESKCKVFNSPHLLVFANNPPDTSTMSKDRWDIHRLDKEYY